MLNIYTSAISKGKRQIFIKRYTHDNSVVDLYFLILLFYFFKISFKIHIQEKKRRKKKAQCFGFVLKWFIEDDFKLGNQENWDRFPLSFWQNFNHLGLTPLVWSGNSVLPVISWFHTLNAGLPDYTKGGLPKGSKFSHNKKKVGPTISSRSIKPFFMLKLV